jgi:predicted ABC-type ATPase
MSFSPAAKTAMRAIGARRSWDESKHPRDPGGEGGGQWVKSGTAEVGQEEETPDEQRRIEELIARAEADPATIEAQRLNSLRGDARDDPGVRNPDGTYTAAGQAENERIARSFLSEDARAPIGTRPVATLLIGKPGAGKSTILKEPEVSRSIPTSVLVNPDEIKDRIPGHLPVYGHAYHERSTDIAQRELMPRVFAGRYNVIFDASGKNPRKMEDLARTLKKLGYEVNVIWADTSSLVAAERVYNRFKSGGRYMPVRVAARDYRSGPRQSYEILKHTNLVDNWRRYDTTSALTLVDRGRAGS